MARNETHEYVRRPISSYRSVADHITDVQKAAEDLENATVDCEIDYDSVVMYVEGYRLLSDEEQAAKRAALNEELAAADERDRAEYERLKAKFGGES
jgi:hypothetical protein